MPPALNYLAGRVAQPLGLNLRVAFVLIEGHPGLHFAQPSKRPMLLHGADCQCYHPYVRNTKCKKSRNAAPLATKFNALPEAQTEIQAYTMELGCYLKIQTDNKLGPYK